jgi:phytoene synthase
VAVGDAAARFGLPMDAFVDLIDGVEMDVRGTSYRHIDDLVGYCRRVAGSIGRLSVAVFGADDSASAAVLGDDLGVAMQLVNILRDVREDRGVGRCYLPAEDLAAFGLDPRFDLADPAAVALVAFEAGRARGWFERGLQLLPMLDRRSAACVGAMTGIYRRLLTTIEEAPAEVLRRRLSLSPLQKAWVAARCLSGVGG